MSRTEGASRPACAIRAPAARAASDVAFESSMYETPFVSATFCILCGNGSKAANALAIISRESPAASMRAAATVGAEDVVVEIRSREALVPLARRADRPRRAGEHLSLERMVCFQAAVAVQMILLEIEYRGGYWTEGLRMRRLHLETGDFNHRPLRLRIRHRDLAQRRAVVAARDRRDASRVQPVGDKLHDGAFSLRAGHREHLPCKTTRSKLQFAYHRHAGRACRDLPWMCKRHAGRRDRDVPRTVRIFIVAVQHAHFSAVASQQSRRRRAALPRAEYQRATPSVSRHGKIAIA